ncbi:galactose mutarotase-like domain-containing protein [Paecilomyces variotii]|uniref:Galactose mutarotase-like domain-containing protein n=1 Tax=Byssochlamys spectabilis TaxID=264951 RepID=A0A443HNX3_BYSSP|nr:galactose mutarotase-like domain-containing protein [Paecilomyces variotii]KAJ9352010.1 hypothetical protein DTO280E4_7954 [Paecilomyces variotii]RWQ93490.1 galactose mutarotase-like domain-containing protein [Paecilomyces variotii]
MLHKGTASRLMAGSRSLLCPSRVSIRLLVVYGLILITISFSFGFKMHMKQYLPVALSVLPALATPAPGSQRTTTTTTTDDDFKVYTISADNITAKFIPYGARLTSLLVPDRSGNLQDVVVGYDDPKEYLHDTETNHTFFGAVVGRYANRIKNGTFEIGTKEYHIPENENGGIDTLHGGPVGYDQRNWTVTASSQSTVTFSLLDSGFEDFPGDVITHATFSVDADRTPENPDGLPRLTTKLVSLALTEKTPIMLANHIYWNLNAFKEETILNDTFLQLPLSQRYVATDGILIPNGTIADVAQSNHGVMDFTSGKLVGQDLQYSDGVCGTGCYGYDNCFIVDRPPATAAPDSIASVLKMNSSTTGIALEVATNQQALQIYACNGQNGTIPVKESQIKRNNGGAKFVNKHGCLVIETEGWIDGINNPQWGQLPYQEFSPESGPAVNWATYTFSTIP